MDETIKKSQQENSNEPKIDLSLQDAEEDISKLRKRIKSYKMRRFQIILVGVLTAFIDFIILTAPNIVNYRYGSYRFTATALFFVIISLGLSVAFVAAIIF